MTAVAQIASAIREIAGIVAGYGTDGAGLIIGIGCFGQLSQPCGKYRASGRRGEDQLASGVAGCPRPEQSIHPRIMIINGQNRTEPGDYSDFIFVGQCAAAPGLSCHLIGFVALASRLQRYCIFCGASIGGRCEFVKKSKHPARRETVDIDGLFGIALHPRIIRPAWIGDQKTSIILKGIIVGLGQYTPALQPENGVAAGRIG